MSVRNVQFAVSQEVGSRKDKLKGVTWYMIVEAGIAAFEKNGVSKKKKPPKKKESERELENEIKAGEKFLLNETLNEDVLTREYDVVQENMWVTFTFEEIAINQNFRVRETKKNGTTSVLKVGGFKEFKKLSGFEDHEGKSKALIETVR
jgi:hypothetical protein